MNEIMKPMSVARSEFMQNLTALINGCKLPPFVVEAILKDMYNDMRMLSQRQLEMDLKNYQEAVKQANTES